MENTTFNGTFQVKISADQCLSIFSDPMNLSKCIWGLESIEKEGDLYSCRVRFDVSEAEVASLSSFRLAECLKPELMDRPDLDLLSQYNTYFLLD